MDKQQQQLTNNEHPHKQRTKQIQIGLLQSHALCFAYQDTKHNTPAAGAAGLGASEGGGGGGAAAAASPPPAAPACDINS